MVRKSAMRVLVVMGLLVTGAGCSVLEDDSKDVPDLVVAATLELTGTNADIGQAHQRALVLRAEQINASGVLGDRRLRVVTRDNKSDPATAVAQITDFAADSTVSAIITGACSPCSFDGRAVANSKQVPLISLAPATSITQPTEAGVRNFVFKVGPNGTDNVRALVTEMTPPGAPVRRLGALFPDDRYGDDAVIATNTATAGARVDYLAGAPRYKADGSDLGDKAKALVADKAADKKPEVVLVWALPAQAGPAAAALRQAGFTGQIYFDGAAAGNLFLGGAANEGATVVFPETLAMDDVIATTPAKAARKQWFEDYTARWGAYHGHASFAADALESVVKAVDRSGSTDRAAVQAVLESYETDGLSGPIRMTPSNHSGLMPQALEAFVAKGGRWRLLG